MAIVLAQSCLPLAWGQTPQHSPRHTFQAALNITTDSRMVSIALLLSRNLGVHYTRANRPLKGSSILLSWLSPDLQPSTSFMQSHIPTALQEKLQACGLVGWGPCICTC